MIKYKTYGKGENDSIKVKEVQDSAPSYVLDLFFLNYSDGFSLKFGFKSPSPCCFIRISLVRNCEICSLYLLQIRAKNYFRFAENVPDSQAEECQDQGQE